MLGATTPLVGPLVFSRPWADTPVPDSTIPRPKATAAKGLLMNDSDIGGPLLYMQSVPQSYRIRQTITEDLEREPSAHFFNFTDLKPWVTRGTDSSMGKRSADDPPT